jgi:hypothetical protein
VVPAVMVLVLVVVVALMLMLVVDVLEPFIGRPNVICQRARPADDVVVCL